MNAENWDTLKIISCDEPLELNERDGELFLRHQAMCRECAGLDKCRERGWIMQSVMQPDKNRLRIGMGPCLLRKRQNEERKIQKLFSQAAIPLGLQKCSLDNFVTTGMGKSVKRAKLEAENAIETSCSLVLAGGIGVGKTHLAAAIVRGVILQGRSAMFISALGYLEHLKNTFENSVADLYHAMTDHVKSVNCLAIDDFGAEKPSEWTIERLYDLINTRIERNLQTIITTNYVSAPALIKRMSANPLGAQSIVSRLFSFGWLPIEGEDYRVLLRKQRTM
jgi:DNA replication protein DnaC